jgi:hypothetical protein
VTPGSRRDVHISLDLTVYDLPGYRQQGISAVKTARVVVTDDPGWHGGRLAPNRYLVQFDQAAIAERLYFQVAHYFHLPQQPVFWTSVAGAPDLIAAAVRLEAQALLPEQIDLLAGSVTHCGKTLPLSNAIDYLRHVALRAYLGADGSARPVVRGTQMVGVSAADCVPYARDADGWRRSMHAQRLGQSATAAVVVLEGLEMIARHPEIVQLIGDDLERSPFPSLQKGLEEYYIDAVRVTHAALVEYLQNEGNLRG